MDSAHAYKKQLTRSANEESKKGANNDLSPFVYGYMLQETVISPFQNNSHNFWPMNCLYSSNYFSNTQHTTGKTIVF